MRNLAIFLILLGLLALSNQSHAQKIVIVNQYADSSGQAGRGYYLDRVEKHQIVVNYYKAADTSDQSRLTELLRSALFFYLDQGLITEEAGFKWHKSPSKMMKDMQQIVTDGVRYYDFLEGHRFTGFSQEVERQIRLVETPGDAGQDPIEPKAEYPQLSALKEQIENEIHLYVGTQIFTLDNQASPLTESERMQLIEEINNFGTGELMSPLSFDFASGSVSLLASDDEFMLLDHKKTNTEGDFAEKVLSAIESNNKKLDLMQNQINEIRNQQERQWRTQQEAANLSMQTQINELRDLIVTLVSNKAILPPTESAPVAIANLPSHIDINFERGSTSIHLEGEYKLNEITDLMVRHKNLKLIITGYADATGNAQANLNLSQQRAQSVKNYIAKSGIAKDRLVINYFGDRDSAGANPDDRRVSIKFVNP